MSRTKKKSAHVPSQRDMAQRMLIERQGAGAGKHHTRERDVLKGIRRKGKHQMNYDENPYHKPGQDQYGRVCFFIYNDDGSQVVGPTGPKFCYSVEKAEEMVRKAEAAGLRVSPSAVSPGPRPTPAAPTGFVRERIQEAAARPITHRIKVGEMFVGTKKDQWYLNDDLYRVTAVSPGSVMLEEMELRDISDAPRPWDAYYDRMPTGRAARPAFRTMLNADGTFKTMSVKPWDGKPIQYRPFTG
jgi:hypothetical protein